jgi:folate-binding protein YgfZ
VPDIPHIRDEYRIILDGAGWTDRPGRGRLRLEGADAASFLQALVSNDVTRVEPGQGVYATYLTPNGRMLADLEVYRRPDAWLLALAAERATPVAERLDQSIFSEDVRVYDVTSAFAEIVVVGGAAAARLAEALPVTAVRLDALSELGQIEWRDGFIARIADSTLPMFTIVVPIDRSQDAMGCLEGAGVQAISGSLVEALRIEAGRPRFGVDMTEETIPLEAGLLDRAISTTKGCYVGQEIIIRILHRGGGRVAKRLVTLSFDASPNGSPAPGTPLFDGDKPIGQLTSVSPALTSQHLIALGYVHRDLAEKGRQIVVGDTGRVATVTGFAR